MITNGNQTNQSTDQPFLAAARILHRQASDETEAANLIDLLQVEVSSGSTIKQALNTIAPGVCSPLPPKRKFEPGFSLTPKEYLDDRAYMERINHVGRLQIVYMSISNGGQNDIYVSNKTLMAKTYIDDERSVLRAKQQLIRDGFISEIGCTRNGVKILRVNPLKQAPDTPPTDPSGPPRPIRHPNRPCEIDLKTTPTHTPPDPEPVTSDEKVVVLSLSKSGGKPELPAEPEPIVTQTITNEQVEVAQPLPTPPEPEPTPPPEPTETLHPSLNPSDDKAIRQLLNRLTKDQASELLDELYARLNGEGQPVRNPVGFTASLVRSVQNGTWAPSASRRVADKREAETRRSEEQKRKEAEEAASKRAEDERKDRIEAIKSHLSKKALEQHRSDFIFKLKAESDWNYKRLKRDNFRSIGFRILFDSYLLEAVSTNDHL